MTVESQLKYHFSINAHFSELRNVRNFVKSTLKNQNIKIGIIDNLVLVVDEVCSNTIEHSYQKRDNQTIMIDMILKENEIEIDIMDNGIPFEKEKYSSPSIFQLVKSASPGGLGLMLVYKIADLVEYTKIDNLNICKIVKKIS